MVSINFKHNNLIEQFESKIDPRLQAFLLWLSYWINTTYNQDITVTCFNRTVEENKKINGALYSAHLSGRAVDIRSWVFSTEQIQSIQKKIDESWGDLIYFKYHDSGSGKHIHVNIRYKYLIKDYNIV